MRHVGVPWMCPQGSQPVVQLAARPLVWQSTIVPKVKRQRRRGLVVHGPAQRFVGVGALVLLCVTAAAALILAQRYHLGVPAIAVSILGGLPGLFLAWAAISSGPGAAGSLDLATVADQLALAVGGQWRVEANLWRLNDPYPLPVSWTAADPSLTDAWESLVKLAASGAGWPYPPPTGTWAAGPDGLAGAGGELVEVLRRVPTGRLVVLGEPGAGKTMLMVRLVLDLLARRTVGGPVPILVSVASWNPVEQNLQGWLVGQLTLDYPALGLAPPAGLQEPTQAAALLASGLILPILDGLDEIPEAVRGSAISRINDALRPGEYMVATCRSRQYRDAIRPEAGVEVTLRAAAAIELRPLNADAVRHYLCDDAAGPVAKARWDPVLAVLGTETPAGQALETPLMVGLARTVYNARPGELAGALGDPAGLCDPALVDRGAVESKLFDAFIPAAYRHVLTDRWNAQDAESWLEFLARHAEVTGVSYLAWWDLPWGVPVLVLVVGVAAFIAVVTFVMTGIVGGAVFGAAAAAAAGAWVGAVIGAVSSFMSVPRAKNPIALPLGGIRWGLPSRRVVSFAAMIGIATGAVVKIVAGAEWFILAGISAAVLACFVGWILFQRLEIDFANLVASPSAVLARDRRTAIALGVVPGFVFVVIIIVAYWAVGVIAHHFTINATLVAVVFSGWAFFGTTISFQYTAWPSYEVARIWLALHHRLPWALTAFFTDAHKRGVLRQAGAVYQFRHIELQHRLASRWNGQESERA
jgi:NACHT domain